MYNMKSVSFLLVLLIAWCLSESEVTNVEGNESILTDNENWSWYDARFYLDTEINSTQLTSRGKTPSPTCQLIAESFGWAISNFTLCSVRNARPIHLCEKCIRQYIQVRSAHDNFEATIDEEGNICRDYFVNLDRLQIVSEAYHYVDLLWTKANCNSCFKKTENGSLTADPTENTRKFDRAYRKTRDCFKNHIGQAYNLTCLDCLNDYKNLTETYIEIEDSSRDTICMDIVDTMNITRFLWSNKFGCVKRQGVSTPLKIILGSFALIPLVFYTVAFCLAKKQEAPVLQQKRLAEIFAVNSNSVNVTGDDITRPQTSQFGRLPINSSGISPVTRRH